MRLQKVPGPCTILDGETRHRFSIQSPFEDGLPGLAVLGSFSYRPHAVFFGAAPTMLAALIDAEESIRCAAGCEDSATPTQIDSDVMSWGGSPMAVTYNRIVAAIAEATGE